MTSMIRPQSESRAAFFHDVIEYANRFMRTKFDRWRSKATPSMPSEENGNPSSPIQETFRMQNSDLAGKLATLAKSEISDFFRSLEICQATDRGEVMTYFSNLTYFD